MKRIALGLAISTALGLTACGGGGGGGSSSSTSGATVSGAASKGIVINGLVSAYLFDAAGVPETTPVDTAITGADGTYSLDIPSQHNGKPLYVVVDDNNGAASMKCDIAVGCDLDGDTTADAEFGETLELEAGDLSMSAVLPESTATVSVNVTPLTTVAAALAKDAISSGAVTDFNIKEAVNNANSQVSNRFGLTQDITKIPIVDLTDPVAVASQLASSDEAVKAAAMNAAIVSAMQSDDSTNGTTINSAIQSFATNFATSGLTNNSSSPEITDLGDILEDAQAIIQEVEDDIEALGDEYADAVTNLQALETAVVADTNEADSSEASDDGSQGEASPTANASNLAQVKAFVEELRELGTAIDSSLVGEGEQSQTVQAVLDDFDLQIDAADMASSDDLEYTLQGIADALGSMAQVYEKNFAVEDGLLVLNAQGEYREGYSAEDYPDAVIATLPVLIFEEGIGVNVSLVDGVVQLSVDAPVQIEDDFGELLDVTVDLTATVTDFTYNETGSEYENYNEATDTYTWGDEGQGSGSIDLAFVGSASYGSITASILEGSSAQADATLSYQGDGEDSYDDATDTYSGSYEDYLDARVATFDLQLNVAIEQTEVGLGQADGAMSFEGSLGVEVNSLRFIEDTLEEWIDSYNEQTGYTYSETDYEDISLRAGVVNLLLSGTFGNDENSFDASFTLTGDASGVQFRDIYEWSGSNDSGQWLESESTESVSGETNANWSDLTATLSFSADLAGISQESELDFELTATRTGYDDFTVSLDLRYPGRVIEIESEFNNTESDAATGELTLTNNDGVVISVTGDESIAEEDGQFTVEIRKDTNEDGVVDEDDFLYAWYEVRNGIELLVFADDKDTDNIEFESLF